jgi:hypothetical protein
VGQQLQSRASQCLAALSAQRFSGCRFNEKGGLALEQGGKPVPLASVPVPDRDLAYLAVKLATLERELANGKLIAVCEDAFAGLPEGARRAVAQLLKAMARTGQVLHATTDPVFRLAADNAV